MGKFFVMFRKSPRILFRLKGDYQFWARITLSFAIAISITTRFERQDWVYSGHSSQDSNFDFKHLRQGKFGPHLPFVDPYYAAMQLSQCRHSPHNSIS
jgi:hypothetical protein